MKGEGERGFYVANLERARTWAPYLKKMKGMGSMATARKAKRAPDQK